MDELKFRFWDLLFPFTPDATDTFDNHLWPKIEQLIEAERTKAVSEYNDACESVCKGFSNEELETLGHFKAMHETIVAENERLRELNAELVKALELYMKRHNNGWMINLAWREDTHSIMQEALNKAKGCKNG